MSNPELIYLAPECHDEGERLWCEDDVWDTCHECDDGNHCVEAHPSVRYVRGDVHDTLAQRCRELEHRIGVSALDRENSTARRDQAERKCDTLRAEVADLKARLLEAERGNEALVRLRAERRELEKDGARLAWMLDEECNVRGYLTQDGVRYGVVWSDLGESQAELFFDPRTAIDAAILNTE